MRTGSKLLKAVNDALPPEVLRELSTELGLPFEKASLVFESVVPSLLMAFTHQGPEVGRLLNKPVTGTETIRELLGNEFTDFATKLQPFTNLAIYPIITMMEKLVPKVIPVLREYLREKDLRDTLEEETSSLAEIVPTDISNYFGYGTFDTRIGQVSSFSEGRINVLVDYPKT